MKKKSKAVHPEANYESLLRIFTVPESENSTLGKIEKQISENLIGFLKEHIVSRVIAPNELERNFLDSQIPEDPTFVSEQADFLLKNVVAESVHVASPRFIGHMTSALPYFMLPLSKMMIALNQNLVKIETSKAFTPLERQVLGMLHRLIYNRNASFYEEHIQYSGSALGAFCSDGTIANLTALWVAINRLFQPQQDFAGIGEEGLFAAMQHYEYQGAAILVSRRGHYSLKKAANLLGIGRRNLISIPTDANNKIIVSELLETIQRCKKQRIAIVAVVGIAGTTETGSVDPLNELADICEAHDIHFHVDAAWGGPTLFSRKYKHLLKGIERADSVTFDAHKQLYVPMGAGMALFKDHKSLTLVAHYAEYIIRKGSRDLGRMTIEGSRPGMAMLVHSGLRIMGRKGYELLIDGGIEKARTFANMINATEDFELISEPELNLLTYRFVPADVRRFMATCSREELFNINAHLNRLTITIQKEQRDRGASFVSRTALEPSRYHGQLINVFRVVLANPLTQVQHLEEILAEQREIARRLLSGELALDYSEQDEGEPRKVLIQTS
ncbi:pyridoxal-dependent aspartate 1-decarboxylase PanP [Oligoflexus tunisiensis]|uniref:pyridoxal-dependent aspartate 1-decarboxylase PanP n=1 Tax=Oligoflexus tunisiensis TaxID=708132 RepID=UPI001C40642B|nr:putative pyridoxal-dependent aspartate 1-decarboxylase [Oligoflexus tunisiensis]